MSVDRSWMDRRIATDKNEVSSEFCSKVEAFLVFAFDHPQCVNLDKIKCPCKKCENLQWKERGDVKHDLHAYGFKQDYISWIYHGENDQLLKDVEVPLYDGHEKHTTLSAVTELLHFKTEHNFSEKAFNDLLPLIKEFLPADNNLPGSYNDTIRALLARITNDGIGVSSKFRGGVEAFLVFAYDHPHCVSGDKIKCPCKNCGNLQWKERGDVKYDLFANGFKPDYTHWIHHGEPSLDGQNPDSDQVDVGSSKNTVVDAANSGFDCGIKGDFDNGINAVKPNDQLLKDVEVPLYDGHKNHTILSAVTKLLHFKREHNCSGKAFDDLVKLIKEFLPANDKLPRTYCDVKQLVEKLNLGNEYMNACDNDEAT